MVNFKKTNATKNRYSIEKDFQNQIEPLEHDIQSLKKRYEAILNDAQKTFEANEKDYNQSIRDLKKAYTKAIRKHEKDADNALKASEATLKNLKRKHQEELETLNRDHSKRQQAIYRRIKSIESEKEKTLSTIKEKHEATTKAYQEKVTMYEENLNVNKQDHGNKLDRAIQTLKKAYQDENKRAKKIKKAVDEEMKNLEDAISTLNARIQADIASRKKSVDQHINTIRKTLNQNAKAVDKIFSDMLQEFHPVNEALNESFDTFNTYIAKHHEAFKQDVAFDIKVEMHRLNERLENEGDLDKSTRKDIEAQLKLNQLRKTALFNHADAKESLLNDVSQTLQSVTNTLMDSLKSSIASHETLRDTLISQYKKKLEIYQKATHDTNEHLQDFIDTFNTENTMKPFKDFFNNVFEALHDFERQRLSVLNDTFETLKPYYEEMDDIRFFLDTKEARKEIAINQERIATEQNDASVRSDMELTKRNHDLTINALEHDHTIQEKKALQTIETEKHSQAINDIKARNHAEKEKLKIEHDKQMLDYEHALKQQHAQTDKAQLLRRKDVDLSINEKHKAIKALEHKKHYALKHEEIANQYQTSMTRQQIKIKETEAQLDRLTSTIEQTEKRINATYDRKKDNTLKAHDKNIADIEQELEKLKNDHEDKRAFIEQAYNRETRQAHKNIESVNDLKQQRITPIKAAIDDLESHFSNNAFTHDEAELKTILTPIKTINKNALKAPIEDMKQTLEEAIDTTLEKHLKIIDEKHTRKRRLHQQREKLKSEAKHAKKDVAEVFDAYENDLVNALNVPLKSVEQKGHTSLKTLRKLVSSALNNAFTIHSKAYETFENTLNHWFDPLTAQDQERLQKAKDSYEQSITEETSRYHTEKSPVEDALKTAKSKRDAALDAIETSRTEAFEDALNEQYGQKIKLEDRLKTLQEEKDALDTWLETQKTTIENTYASDMETLEETFKTYATQIEEKYQAQLNKISERLEQSRALYEQSINNANVELEMSENTLQDTLEANQEHYNLVSEQQNQIIEDAKQEKETAKEDANEKLNKKLNAFEDQITSSKSQLDEQIDKVSRELNDTIQIKQKRFDYLQTFVKEKEYGVYDAYQEAFEQLISTIENHYQNIDAITRDGFESIENIKNAHTTMIDNHIQSTIDDITSTTSH